MTWLRHIDVIATVILVAISVVIASAFVGISSALFQNYNKTRIIEEQITFQYNNITFYCEKPYQKPIIVEEYETRCDTTK